MIDEIRMQAFIDKIEAVQESYERTCDKFSEILNLVDNFSETVNGYPAQAVSLLKDLENRLDNLECYISNLNTRNEERPKGFYIFFYIISALFFAISGSFIGTIFHGIIFKH